MKRNCIIVIGMHRCGTSATAGCFSILGYNTGVTALSTDKFNEKGYFENNSIYRFNIDLLNTLSANWKRTMFLPEKWWTDKYLIKQKEELKIIIENEFGLDNDFILKDPRISKLLPFYTLVLSELNINSKIVICYRNPHEVSQSLKNRDNLSIPNSLNLYADSIFSSIRYSNSFKNVLLDYGSMVNEPVEVIESILNTFGIEKELPPLKQK